MNIEILLLLLVLLALCVQLARSRRNPAADSEVLERALREELRVGREEASRAGRELREEVGTSLKSTTDSVTRTMGELGKLQKGQLEAVTGQVKDLAETNHQRIDRLRESIDKQLTELREGNEKKLEEMRITVDEKLQTTLEKRLGESFKLVGDRLEAVQRGLGEMQNLATGVGDLKRVLTNVKLRGTWAEYQLGAILEQILTPDQFDKNVAIRAGSAERVEYAVRLPGPDDDPKRCL
ncbi:MAG: DNA recombination protein RmuC, partial [Myxococcota bacterium]